MEECHSIALVSLDKINTMRIRDLRVSFLLKSSQRVLAARNWDRLSIARYCEHTTRH